MRSITLIAILIGATERSGTTDVGSPGVPVAGLWSYAGQQVAPGSAALGGTLSFTEAPTRLVSPPLWAAQGRNDSFCIRQFNSSATYSSFSDGQAIS